MRFLSLPESRDWCAAAGIHLDAASLSPLSPRKALSVRCAIPNSSTRLAWFAAWLTVTVPAINERLVCITETGIWPSSESASLVKHLRQGYGETRSVEEAPGTLATANDVEDLAAWLMVAILSGWDVVLAGTQDVVRIFISHDEWVEFSSDAQGMIDQIVAEAEAAELRILEPRAV
jgi:hypothetical protein